jgi:hypothetical protein
MKHIKLFEEDSKELLTTMQGLSLAPKPLGFWITMVTSSEVDTNAIGIAIVAPDLPTVAECLFEEFNLEDYFEDYDDKTWKDLPATMEKLKEMLDGTTIYNWWKMEPKSTNNKETSIETESLLNPAVASQLGQDFFKNFDEELKRNPAGL